MSYGAQGSFPVEGYLQVGSPAKTFQLPESAQAQLEADMMWDVVPNDGSGMADPAGWGRHDAYAVKYNLVGVTFHVTARDDDPGVRVGPVEHTHKVTRLFIRMMGNRACVDDINIGPLL